jgi:hypothetical protein
MEESFECTAVNFGNVISDDIKEVVPSLKNKTELLSEIWFPWPGENRDNKIVSIQD